MYIYIYTYMCIYIYVPGQGEAAPGPDWLAQWIDEDEPKEPEVEEAAQPSRRTDDSSVESTGHGSNPFWGPILEVFGDFTTG